MNYGYKLGDRVETSRFGTGTVVGACPKIVGSATPGDPLVWLDLRSPSASMLAPDEVDWIDPIYRSLAGFDPFVRRFWLILETERHFWIKLSKVVEIKPVVLFCCTCNEPGPYAAPNLPDGRFQCYACRSVGRRIKAA